MENTITTIITCNAPRRTELYSHKQLSQAHVSRVKNSKKYVNIKKCKQKNFDGRVQFSLSLKYGYTGLRYR